MPRTKLFRISLVAVLLISTTVFSLSTWATPGRDTVAPVAAQSTTEELEAFRQQLSSYFSDLRALTEALGAPASVQDQLAQSRQDIAGYTPETLELLKGVFPTDPEWWSAPADTLASLELSDAAKASLLAIDSSARPIQVGVAPNCEQSVLEELIIARAALTVAEIAKEFTPSDEVLVVLGEGGTLATHPARIIAMVVVSGLSATVTALEQVQEAHNYCWGSNSQAIVHDFLQIMTVDLQVMDLVTLGCSQGYWKNHTERWDSAIAGALDLAPNYDPSTLFDSVFGDGADQAAGVKNGATLLDVLSAKGGDTIAQARDATTLLLNNDALAAGIDLPCTPVAVTNVGDFAPILGPFTRRFIVSAEEGGLPVDVDVVEVQASTMNPSSLSFTDVTATSTVTPVKAGVFVLEVTLPDALAFARGFQITVVHDEGAVSLDDQAIYGLPTGVDIKHYGTILFHQQHDENLGMGQ